METIGKWAILHKNKNLKVMEVTDWICPKNVRNSLEFSSVKGRLGWVVVV